MSLRDATRPHTQIASVNPHIVYSQTSEKCAQKLNAVIEEVNVRIKSEKKADNKKISEPSLESVGKSNPRLCRESY